MSWPGLEDAALEAAASRGLLRRAERDVAAGLARVRHHDGAGAVVEVDGAVVTLTPAGIRAARCTCPSREVCRHVLAAALLVRRLAPADAAPPDPVGEIKALSEAALANAFGKAAMRDGARLLGEAGPAEIVVEGAACRIRLPGQPDVVFAGGGGLAGMLSKATARQAKALHAAAIQAVRGGSAEREPVAEVPPETPVDPQFLAQVRAAMLDAARSAFRNAPRALEDQLLDLAVSSRADSVPALAALLRQAAVMVHSRRDHDPAFDPAALLAILARGFALAEALGGPGSGAVRGAVRQSFMAVPGLLDLVGCGVEVWRAASGARGATAHLYAPALDRWFSATLARAAGQDPGFKPDQAARRLADAWGHPLATVGAARVRLTGAEASTAGRLSLGAKTLAVLTPLAPMVDEIGTWPGVFDDWARLGAHLSAAFSPALRSGAATSVPVMLRPASLAPARFDDVAQRLVLPAQDAAGVWIGLVVDQDERHPERGQWIEAVARPEVPCPTLLFAAARASAGQFSLHPYADLPAEVAAPRSFDLTPPPKHLVAPLPGVMWPQQPSGTSRLLATILDEMLGFCELGGQMQDPGRDARLATLADGCETLGLQPLARAVSRVASAASKEARASAVLSAVHIASSLSALRRTLQVLSG